MIKGSRFFPVLSCLLMWLTLHTQYGVAAPAHTALGLQQEDIRVGRVLRSYYVRIPSLVVEDTKPPLVIVLHGGGKGDGLSPAKYLGFTQLAESEGFIVAYPNGVNDFWSDGRDHSFRDTADLEPDIDDIEFISVLIAHFINHEHVDPHRVYVTGISNGGIMTMRIGCELSEQVAAIAPITANIAKNIYPTCRPTLPVPILLMNGRDDPMVPYGGGFVGFKRQKRGEVVSTSQSILLWAKHNGCLDEPKRYYLSDLDSSDDSRIFVTDYSGNLRYCGVILYTVEGGGHTLPGSNVPDMPRLLGTKNNDIDGAATIWDFLKQHSR